jgi:nucleoside 2-deoxyribosyltransferase
MNLFIGGPITNLIKNDVFDKDFKEKLLSVIDYFKGQGYCVLNAHEDENFGKNIPEDVKYITKRDLNWIDQANILCFVLPCDKYETPIRTDGTYIEIGYSIAKNKKTFLIVEDNHLCKYSPMLQGISYPNVIFTNRDDYKKYFRCLNG